LGFLFNSDVVDRSGLALILLVGALGLVGCRANLALSLLIGLCLAIALGLIGCRAGLALSLLIGLRLCLALSVPSPAKTSAKRNCSERD
jgi:hypothetical protein